MLEELRKQVHAAILERLWALAIRTLTIEPYARAFLRGLLDKHYYRKHGERACYGQERGTGLAGRRLIPLPSLSLQCGEGCIQCRPFGCPNAPSSWNSGGVERTRREKDPSWRSE